MSIKDFVGVALGILLLSVAPAATRAASTDGSKDFDWDIGLWNTHQRVLVHPFSGSTTWLEYRGTDRVQRLWNGGLAATIEAAGPAGRFEVFSVRLYNSDSHQWSIYFANPSAGSLGKPVVGTFHGNSADFVDQEPYKGRMILVRFSLTSFTHDACHFQQAFSDDGGKTWEVNFVVDETRATGR